MEQDEQTPEIDSMDTNALNIGKAMAVTLPPTITYAAALAGVARHYVGGIGATVVGGLVGYLIGAGSQVDDDDRRAMVADIMAAREEKEGVGAMEGKGSEGGGGIMSAGDLLNYRYKKYDFDGKWGALVGQPSINFHAMVFGRPKQGKSILSVQWAKYLSENFGRVLYVASEEGFSVTLQKKISEFAMANSNLDFANFRDFEQIKSAVNRGRYKFVFIDSVNYIKITPEDVETIKEENPGTAFITIQQATKGGQFRGSQEFAHNCDIIIQVEAGVASHQGRFQENTEMAIFDKPEGTAQNAQNEKSAPAMGAPISKIGQMDLFGGDYSQQEMY
jgi:hypothetical protein